MGFLIIRNMPKIDSPNDMYVKVVKYSFAAKIRDPKIMKPPRKRKFITTFP